MKWRVIAELTGSYGNVRSHEVGVGGSNNAECIVMLTYAVR